LNVLDHSLKNVLFLCTGNSARSILAEAILNGLAKGRFIAYSAGSRPAGQVNPGALRKLAAEDHGVEGLSSKSWQQFSGDGAPRFDIVVTVCDNAAGESCPIWNGDPVKTHWGIADPARVENEEASDAAFDLAYRQLRHRIEHMLLLSPDLPPDELRSALQRIHEQACDTESRADGDDAISSG
jgi:arsenate reductase